MRHSAWKLAHCLNCYWVGSSDFNFLVEIKGVSTPPKSYSLFSGGSLQQPRLSRFSWGDPPVKFLASGRWVASFGRSTALARTSGKKRIFVDGRMLHEMTAPGWGGERGGGGGGEVCVQVCVKMVGCLWVPLNKRGCATLRNLQTFVCVYVCLSHS